METISTSDVDRMVDHLRNATTDLAESDLVVPAAHFTSPAHAASERRLFERLPLVAAHASELPSPDCFIARDVMGNALLLVRQRDGRVAAFRNMCRHRGGRIEAQPSGRKPAFVCQYHGWSYGRDGSLRGVPYEEGFGSLDKKCLSLLSVPCEERHGLVWVTLAGAGAPVADYLGEADAKLAAYALDRATVFLERTISVGVNWKLVMDGAIDILHPQFLHAQGVGKLFQTAVGVWNDYGRHGRVHTARRRLAEKVKAGETVDAAWRYFAGTFVLYPNSMMVTAPDHVEFWTVWPDLVDPSKSQVHIRFVIARDKLDDAMADRLRKSWDILEHAAMNEDFPMEETIQANARAAPEAGFIYGRSELPCQHLHRQLAKDLAELTA